jgi:hypothetical protein
MDDLRRLLGVYEGRVEVCFWGYHPPELRGLRGVRFLDFVPNYDKFFRAFARAGFDIGIAPLRDDEFHRSKCNNKFREFAACGIAGVYSDVEVYSSCVEDGRTGLLVSGEQGAWFRAVSRLVEDAALRRRIQKEAFRFARERYRPEQAQVRWLAHIREVLGAAEGGAAVRPGGQNEHDGGRAACNAYADRIDGERAFAGFAEKAARRCARVVAGVKTGGWGRALGFARLYTNSLRELVRVRRGLSHASRLRRRRGLGFD